MNKFTYTLFTLVACLFCTALSGQSSFVTTYYTDEQGLPQNNVKSVAQDEYGFIWVCTENGIAYFNGSSFTTFNAGDFGLTSNRFDYIKRNNNRLIAKNSNNEYVDIADLSVSRINTPSSTEYDTQFQTYSTKAVEHSSDPKILNSKKHTWKVDNADQLYIYQNDTVEIDVPQGKELYAIAQWNDYLYLAFDTFYTVWNGQQMKHIALPENMHGLFDQYIWNAAENQLFFTNYNRIYKLEQTNDGTLIPTCVGELKDDIAPYLRALFYDGYTLYVASSHKGLVLQRKSMFKTVFNDINLRNIFYGLGRLNDTTFLSSSGKIIQESGKTDTTMFTLWSNALECDKRGLHYRTYENKLIAVDEYGTLDVVTSFPGKLLTLFADTINNTLWIGTDSGGSDPRKLYGMDLTTQELQFNAKIDHTVRTVYPLSDSTLLLGTFRTLLYYNFRTNKYRQVNQQELGEVRYIMPLSDDLLIIFTYGKGLFLYDFKSLSKIALDEREFLKFAHYGFFDNNNTLWVATNRGLFQFDPTTLKRFKDNPHCTLIYRYYDKTTGLYVNEFNGGCNRCAVSTSSGRWVLPSMDGLVFFTPEAVPVIALNEHLIITKAEADGVLFESGDKLPHNTSIVEINIASFQSPFQYSGGLEVRLSESNNWISVPDHGVVRFVGLPHDDYALEIRKPIDIQGTMSTKVFSFTIPPPFWKTSLFYFLIIVILGGSVLLFFRLRLRFLKKQNESLERVVGEQTKHLRALVKDFRLLVRQEKELSDENERVVSILAHDVRSPLRFLSMMFREFTQGRTKLLSSDLEVARETTEHLYSYVEDILKRGRHPLGKQIKTMENVALAKLVKQKISLFSGIAERKNIEVISDVPPNTVVYTDQNILSIVLHNLIDNAIKHNQKETLTIRWDSEDQTLIVYNSGGTVSDDTLREWNELFTGNGGQKDTITKRKSRGMAMIIELSQIANISIEVVKPSKGGLAFRLELI